MLSAGKNIKHIFTFVPIYYKEYYFGERYMETENVKKIYEILNQIPVTKENQETIAEIKECLLNGDFILALEKI